MEHARLQNAAISIVERDRRPATHLAAVFRHTTVYKGWNQAEPVKEPRVVFPAFECKGGGEKIRSHPNDR